MQSANRLDYDVGSDGSFLMIKMPPEDQPREIKVVLDWFQELQDLVGTE